MSSIIAGTVLGAGLQHDSDTTGNLVIKTGASANTAATFHGNAATTFDGDIYLTNISTPIRPKVFGTAVNVSGLSTVPFTIPTWARHITVMFSGLSLTAAGYVLVQIGDSGGIENTGYVSSGGVYTGSNTTSLVNSTAGFFMLIGAPAVASGHMILTNITGNQWVSSHTGKYDTLNVINGGGDKTLSDSLTQLLITTTTATTFDGGTINIMWE